VRPLALLLAAGLALAACGETPRAATEPRVRLKLELPDDASTVRGTDTVEITGTVAPADAAVSVAGQTADVDGGSFKASVKLAPGGNVIDITATSPGRRPATDAVRVKRDMRVEIPELTGQTYDAAAADLSKLGLKATEQSGGSWIDRVLGADIRVCQTSPPAGELVNPQTSVTVATGPGC
jgi:hypothetical protein